MKNETMTQQAMGARATPVWMLLIALVAWVSMMLFTVATQGGLGF